MVKGGEGRGESNFFRSVFFSGSKSPDNCNLWFQSNVVFSVLLEGRAHLGE